MVTSWYLFEIRWKMQLKELQITILPYTFIINGLNRWKIKFNLKIDPICELIITFGIG